MPAFFADLPTSALASSISLRTSVEMSAMALWTRVPTEGSSAPAVESRAAGGTLWATAPPPPSGAAGQGNAASSAAMTRSSAPSGAPPRACEGWGGGGPLSVPRRGRRQLLPDQVHHGGVGERRDVAELAVL